MNRYFYTILTILLVCVVANSNAQRRPPSPPGLPTKAPIDAGLSLLLVAGASLGIIKIRK